MLYLGVAAVAVQILPVGQLEEIKIHLVGLAWALSVSRYDDTDFIVPLSEPLAGAGYYNRDRCAIPESFTDKLVIDKDLHMVGETRLALQSETRRGQTISGDIGEGNLISGFFAKRAVKQLPEPFRARVQRVDKFAFFVDSSWGVYLLDGAGTTSVVRGHAPTAGIAHVQPVNIGARVWILKIGKCTQGLIESPVAYRGTVE